jgi:cellulose 1,4-beta-cellobiosidase
MGWDNNRTRFAEQLSTVIQGTTRGWGSVAGFASNTSNYTPVQELLLPNPDQQVGGQPIKSASFYQYNAHFGELSYVTALRNELIARGAPNRIGMLIDTGRNGWGGPGRPMAANGSSINQYVDSARIDRRLHRGNWCNQASAGIGERPRANPHPGVHAYVWVKPPGESDGISTMLTVPHPDGKQHDPMCSPTYRGSQDANGGNLTGAMGSAPHAGEWFPAHVRALAGNAHPAL